MHVIIWPVNLFVSILWKIFERIWTHRTQWIHTFLNLDDVKIFRSLKSNIKMEKYQVRDDWHFVDIWTWRVFEITALRCWVYSVQYTRAPLHRLNLQLSFKLHVFVLVGTWCVFFSVFLSYPNGTVYSLGYDFHCNLMACVLKDTRNKCCNRMLFTVSIPMTKFHWYYDKYVSVFIVACYRNVIYVFEA